MKTTTRVLIALLAAGTATGAFAQYGATAPAPQPQVRPNQSSQPQAKDVRASKQAIKALSELQTAVKAKDAAAIREKTAAAQAVVSTKEDRYILGQLQLQAAAATNDKAAAMAALDAILASGFLQGAETAPFYRNLSELRYDAKQWDLAAAALEKRIALDPTDIDAVALMAETRAAQDRTAEALAMLQRGLQLQSANGGKPQESWLKRAVSMSYNAKMPNSVDFARQWVAAYPSPLSWQNSIAIYRNTTHPDSEGLIDLLRLMRVTGAMTTSNDFTVYLNALKEQSNFIEGQTALDKAAQSNQFSAGDAQLKEIADLLKAKPRVTAADLSAAAKSGQTGLSLLHIGDRFYGLGDYAKAVETYQQAKAKGADPNLVNERVGVALTAAGDKAGATAAFKSVTGPRAGVAQFWLLYLQSQS